MSGSACKSILSITFDSPYIDRRILLVARRLTGSGYRVRVITTYSLPEKGFEDVEVINLLEGPGGLRKAAGIKDALRRRMPPGLFNLARGVYRSVVLPDRNVPFMEEMIEKARRMSADVYIANDLHALPAGCEAKKASGGLLLYDAHEFYTAQAFLSKREKDYLRGLEERLIRSADAVVTVNDDIKGMFEKAYGIEGVNVVMNAAEDRPCQKKFLHDLAGIGREKRIALYQGAFMVNRNLDLLVKAAEHLKDSVIVMLGWGELEEGLKKTASRRGILGRRIFFVPRVPQSELFSYTRSASLGLIPYPAIDGNTTYATPNKLFEFISSGVPVLANEELITVKRIVKEYGIGETCGFRDASSLARGIEGLLGRRDRLGLYAKNLEAARRELSWEAEGKKMANVVDRLFEKSGSVAVAPKRP